MLRQARKHLDLAHLAYRWHKVRRGVEEYGLRRALQGLVRLARYQLQRPEAGVIRTAREGIEVHFRYPRQFMPTLALFSALVEPEYELMRHVLTRDSVFVDVGGGIGTYTMLAAHYVDQVIHVFEPTGEGTRAIEHNLRANRLAERVSLQRCALSDRRGTLEMTRRESLFVGRMAEPGANAGAATTETVATTTLDAYCSEHGLDRIDVLKVDVEGHETQVLAGAERMLDEGRIDLMILEVDAEKAGLYQSLAERGYAVFYYHPRAHSLARVQPLTAERLAAAKPKGFHCNIVCVRQAALSKLCERASLILT